MLEQALEYAARGWCVFPVAIGGKVPLIAKRDGGHGCSDATTDTSKIREWWGRWPTANVGVATGPRSDLLVVDIDPRHSGNTNMERLAETHGGLSRTPMSTTGGGGWHLWHSYDERLNNTVCLGTGEAGAGGPYDGIDTRGAGGYVVAPPSVTSKAVHPPPLPASYAWVPDQTPTDIGLAPVPSWLIDIVQGNTGRGPKRARSVSNNPEYWRSLWLNGVGAGGRNDAIARMTGYLLKLNLDAVIVKDQIMMWNRTRMRPPLEEREVENTITSICRIELRRKMR